MPTDSADGAALADADTTTPGGAPLRTALESDLYAEAERKMSEAAVAPGLTEQAHENTKSMLTGLCDSLGIRATFTDVRAQR